MLLLAISTIRFIFDLMDVCIPSLKRLIGKGPKYTSPGKRNNISQANFGWMFAEGGTPQPQKSGHGDPVMRPDAVKHHRPEKLQGRITDRLIRYSDGMVHDTSTGTIYWMNQDMTYEWRDLPFPEEDTEVLRKISDYLIFTKAKKDEFISKSTRKAPS